MTTTTPSRAGAGDRRGPDRGGGHSGHPGRPPAANGSGAGLLVRLSLHQFRFDLRAFFRNRQSRFFTLVLPALFLVIFASPAVPGRTVARNAVSP